MSDISEYQKQIYQNKINHQFNVTNIEKEFLLLYGEGAEAFDTYKQGQPTGDELADIAIYLFGLAEILKVDLDTEIQKKMIINSSRKYKTTPQGYSQRIEK